MDQGVIYLFFFSIFLLYSEGCSSHLLLHVIDVGYGDAIFLESSEKEYILIDTGKEEMADRVIDYLNRHGISRLHILVITHLHPDHTGGLDMILDKIDIDELLMAKDISYLEKDAAKSIREKGIVSRIIKRGDKISLAGGVEVDILHPSDMSDNPNDNSIVIRITHKDIVILLAGDIGSSVQKELVDIFGNGLRSHILKVPHHGGGDNLTEFIRRVRPDIAIISVGQNIYNAPDPSVIDTYKEIGAEVMRTDREGSIVIESDGNNIRIIR